MHSLVSPVRIHRAGGKDNLLCGGWWYGKLHSIDFGHLYIQRADHLFFAICFMAESALIFGCERRKSFIYVWFESDKLAVIVTIQQFRIILLFFVSLTKNGDRFIYMVVFRVNCRGKVASLRLTSSSPIPPPCLSFSEIVLFDVNSIFIWMFFQGESMRRVSPSCLMISQDIKWAENYVPQFWSSELW